MTSGDTTSNSHLFNPSYVTPRSDIASLVPPSAKKVLDVGCSNGALGEQIKRSGAWVMGLELDPQMAEAARAKIDRVVTGDLDMLDLDAALGAETFDCIVAADVLEHLKNPWNFLAQLARRLNPGGLLISSIPNVRHFSTLFCLAVLGRWPYRERGIHDRTHLRFFTAHNIRDLFSGAGLDILSMKRHHRIIERPHKYNRFAWIVGFWPFKEFTTFQFLITAAPRIR
jgi:2-polyprenyl-3-methyl-5-hydroxy-6-metoxy-1,4-benzoquinol methylase